MQPGLEAHPKSSTLAIFQYHLDAESFGRGTPIAENAQHEPQNNWFFIPVTAPSFTQSFSCGTLFTLLCEKTVPGFDLRQKQQPENTSSMGREDIQPYNILQPTWSK